MYKLSLLLFIFPTLLFAQTYTPGTSYLGSNGYVEYIAGNLPVVISAPHGGYLEPATIPDRNCSGCVYVRDSYTQELIREIQAAFYESTGCYPHIVINLLHRKKFDANRDIGDAADGNATVEQSWYVYHNFLDSAKASITNNYNRGLFLDLHGHAHTIQRVELGYTLSRSELQLSDSVLNTNNYIVQSSIQELVGDNLQSLSHSELLRGTSSFGTLLDQRGFPAVPSTSIPFALSNEPYFTGGYNTRRHSSLNGGTIDGIQVECNQGIRFDATNRKMFADSITQSIIKYIDIHYNAQFEGNYCSLISKTSYFNKANSFKIYPNPTEGTLWIETDFEELDILVLNNLGQTVKVLKWNGQSLNLNDLEAGLYFLMFKNNGEAVGSQRLIKY